MRVEDFRHVVDYLVTLPYVDDARIGVLGICGGGGYSINAAMTERRIKAVGTITGANYGRLFREGFSNFEPANARVVIGDVLDKKGLALAMHGKDIVYANLAGNVDKQTEIIISVMKSQGVKRLIFVNSLGIYDEVPGAWCLVPGAFGEWNKE